MIAPNRFLIKHDEIRFFAAIWEFCLARVSPNVDKVLWDVDADQMHQVHGETHGHMECGTLFKSEANAWSHKSSETAVFIIFGNGF